MPKVRCRMKGNAAGSERIATAARRAAALCGGLLWAASLVRPAAAEVKLHAIFTSGGVLQQGMKVPVFGTGKDGEVVTLRIQDQQATTVVRDGKWRVEFEPLKPGGPYSLQLSGARMININNISVGEVWLCAGDANMQWQVINSSNSVQSMTSPENTGLRLFTVKREGSAEPRDEVDSFWAPAGAGSVGVFSAVGYHFGREIHRQSKVTVGLISCNHYAATAASLISREALEADPRLKSRLDEQPPDPAVAGSPTVLYNGMVHALTQIAVRGVIYYQGEHDVERAYLHRYELPALIADWRRRWGRSDLPFLFVQAAPYRFTSASAGDSRLAELRESQLLTWRQTPHTAMVVLTDHGKQFDLHPRDKQPVGERLALAARAVAYGEKIVYSGPTYRALKIDGSRAAVEFDFVGGGLVADKGELRGFAIAGADRVFKPAKAVIEGDQVIVTADDVPRPVAVRYGWADFPDVNLRNKEGLPASPFRTDDAPLSTEPKTLAQ